MNKLDIINKIAEETKYSKTDIAKTIDTLLLSIITALQNGEKVNLHGFGHFTKKARKARTVRNPKSGSMIDIKASFTPKFTAGSALKEALNKENI